MVRKQSLRQIAHELDISPACLSYMVNGKRPWRKDLYQRYVGVVNTFVNSEGGSQSGVAAEFDTIRTRAPVAQGIERLPSKQLQPLSANPPQYRITL